MYIIYTQIPNNCIISANYIKKNNGLNIKIYSFISFRNIYDLIIKYFIIYKM